jgi:hypothetical protein
VGSSGWRSAPSRWPRRRPRSTRRRARREVRRRLHRNRRPHPHHRIAMPASPVPARWRTPVVQWDRGAYASRPPVRVADQAGATRLASAVRVLLRARAPFPAICAKRPVMGFGTVSRRVPDGTRVSGCPCSQPSNVKRRQGRNAGADYEGNAGDRLSALTVEPEAAHFLSQRRPEMPGLYGIYPVSANATVCQ